MNKKIFNISLSTPEPLFDSFYAKKKVIIPEDSSKENSLTKNHKLLIDYTTTFKVLYDSGYRLNDKPLDEILEKIRLLMTTTDHINYSGFSQFFMVYNTTFSTFFSLSSAKQNAFLYEMLIKYCTERHEMYKSHGYSNAMLQMMCDNYSHKRNGKTTIEKVLNMLSKYSLSHAKTAIELETDNIYFLPDKGDFRLFIKFLEVYKIQMQSRDIEQDKLPDLVFKHNGHYFICELKSIKGVGGGQNKQLVELIHFIKFSEENENIHYLSFLDCEYANTLFNNSSPKITLQRKQIMQHLENNPQNYFVNTAGFAALLQTIFQNN